MRDRAIVAGGCAWRLPAALGRTHPSAVLACGDSGEGFKYAAFMGEYLADLVAGGDGDPESQRRWDPRRFGGASTPREHFDAIGRH